MDDDLGHLPCGDWMKSDGFTFEEQRRLRLENRRSHKAQLINSGLRPSPAYLVFELIFALSLRYSKRSPLFFDPSGSSVLLLNQSFIIDVEVHLIVFALSHNLAF